MPDRPTSASLVRRRFPGHALLAAGLGMVCCFAFLGARPLWDLDEGMHAVTALEMLRSGDWIVPRFNGEIFYDKPPLFNWLTALAFHFLGPTEWAARFPSALSGFGCVLLTYFLARRLAGPRMGLLAAAILATSAEFILVSRAVVHDMVFTLWVTAAIFFLHPFVCRRSARPGWLPAAYACMGLAVVTKGPLGVLLPALVVFAFVACSRDWKLLPRLFSGRGLLLFLAIAAPWYGLVIARDPGYASYFFIHQNLMNFVSAAEARHGAPVYTYLPVLLAGFFPWSLLLLPAWVRDWTSWRCRGDRDALFLLVWSGAVFLFFSVAQSKLPTYILPLFPAVSLTTARFWETLIGGPDAKGKRWAVWVAALMAGGCWVGLAVLGLWQNPHWAAAYGVDPERIAWLLILLAGGMSLAWRLLSRGCFATAFAAYTGTLVGAMLVVLLMVVPGIDPYRSSKEIGRELARHTAPGQPLVFHKRILSSALFYTGRPGRVLDSGEELLAYLASDPGAMCLIEEKRFRNLDRQTAEQVRIVERAANKWILAAGPTAADPLSPGPATHAPGARDHGREGAFR